LDVRIVHVRAIAETHDQIADTHSRGLCDAAALDPYDDTAMRIASSLIAEGRVDGPVRLGSSKRLRQARRQLLDPERETPAGLIEREVMRVGGIKSLYSESFFNRDEFAAAYGSERYDALKRRYDPERRLLGLYEKCIQRQ
jgi:hypothetical protein